MRYFIGFFIVIILSGCNSKKQVVQERIENTQTEALLQGWWTEIANEYAVVMQFSGDTVNYISDGVAQQTFKVFHDTLYTYGLQTNAYPIIEIGQSKLTFLTSGGETVSLQKKRLTEEETDTFVSTYTDDSQNVSVQEVIKKDKLINYKGKNYHGYVFINPTTIKVLQPEVNDLGFEIEKYNYDNIIHICVYQGKNALYSKDIKKEIFKDVVPTTLFQYSILSNMDFEGVENDDFIFNAEIGLPDNGLIYNVQLRVSQTGEMTLHTKNSN